MNQKIKEWLSTLKKISGKGLGNYINLLQNMKHTRRRKGKVVQTKYSLCVYFPLLFLYLELVFHLFMFHSLKSFGVYPLLSELVLGLVIGVFCSFWRPTVSYWMTAVMTILACLFFCVQVIYYAVFQHFLEPFGMMKNSGQALDFTDTISRNIGANIASVIILMIPVILYFWFAKRRLYYGREHFVQILTGIGTAVVLQMVFLFLLQIGSHDLYSGYDLYYHNVSTDQSVKSFGVLATVCLNGKYAIFGAPVSTLAYTTQVETEIGTAEAELAEAAGTADTEVVSANTGEVGKDAALDETQEAVLDTSPNVMEIDFDSIKANTDSDDVQQLCDYFVQQTPTNKNEYTGLFEGYNLIFITAEGFTNYCISEELTPTLYKLSHEGFVFNNFYTPIWYGSTADGEYANLSGNLPTDGVVSFEVTGENSNNMMFTLGRQLQNLNYTLNAYHANSYTYYERDLYIPNMGYDWKATGNWFVPEADEDGDAYWPQSDLTLVEQSINEYVDSQPFHTYYMSISGHMEYGFDTNYMAQRNEALVADLPYSDQTRAYIAANLELEKAVTKIVDTLEEKGIADKTAIVLCADHVPYDYKEISDEIAGETLDDLDWQRNALIIWSGSMTEPVVVDKYCYDVDILPTVSNLMGLTYDSRLLSGQDILSDSSPLVMFLDRSFITDQCIYNATSDQVTSLTGAEISSDYLSQMKALVYNKFQTSTMVLNSDFYSYVDTVA